MKTPRTAARIPPTLRRRLDRGLKSTNQSETSILIAALTEWFAAHQTTDSKIESIVRAQSTVARAA